MEGTSIEALQAEVEFYRRNQVEVEQEIRNLIADNQKLSHQLGQLIREKLELARGSHDPELGRTSAEMSKQVTLLTKERDSLHVLWQTSQKTVDALETELKTYQGYNGSRGLQDTASEKRNLELKLESSVTDYVDLETKYKELHSKHNATVKELETTKKEVNTYKERGKALEQKLEEVSKDLDDCRVNFLAGKRSIEDLQSQLLMLQKECVGHVKKEAEAKSKVAEALQLFDVVNAQKNEAFKKIEELTGELLKSNQNLSRVRQATETRLRAAADGVRDKYNEKVSDMLRHVRHLDEELVQKGILLSKALRENEILQAVNDKFLQQHNESLSALDPKLAVAEQRLEAMYQELVSSERRNIQLVCEKQCLAMDLQRIQDLHSRDSKRRDWEESLLKTECEELRAQVNHLQKSLQETHGMVNKLQGILSSRTELNQKMVSTKEEQLTELNKHLENQIELSRKWKDSYVEMTEKLKKRLDDLQKENQELSNKLQVQANTSSSNLDEDGSN